MAIRKAVIPAAGLGTRFLPATKAIPKEMIPIVDKPVIQYIVEEASKSGIEEIIIITSRGKNTIEDHFDRAYELEEALLKKNNIPLYDAVRHNAELANIHYIRQQEPKGLGHAIYCAKSFIGKEPFAVLLGDDVVAAKTPALQQLIQLYNRYHTNVIGVKQVAEEQVSKYGMIKPKEQVLEKGLYSIESLVEKPRIEEAPSNMAIMGRYILMPEIFDILENLPAGSGGEIQLTDALNMLTDTQSVLGYQFQGSRYDIGDKAGFIRANVEFALQRADLRDNVLKWMMELVKRNE
ncbi:UTP--glucose-1-phosphate uridylyltransferase GalU [Radiobacillus sp. PE A8.2]|uniref:UTP--glucose-1-phosphate uridylyltransferase GalU n=1 Tax=Radiobacillus sp. PE A8.2 TaxID=3380349 RepID=UPI00388DE62F